MLVILKLNMAIAEAWVRGQIALHSRWYSHLTYSTYPIPTVASRRAPVTLQCVNSVPICLRYVLLGVGRTGQWWNRMQKMLIFSQVRGDFWQRSIYRGEEIMGL